MPGSVLHPPLPSPLSHTQPAQVHGGQAIIQGKNTVLSNQHLCTVCAFYDVYDAGNIVTKATCFNYRGNLTKFEGYTFVACCFVVALSF